MKEKFIVLFLMVLFLGCVSTDSSTTTQGSPDSVEINTYTISGSPTWSAFLSLEYSQLSNSGLYVNVLADLNNDGSFDSYSVLNHSSGLYESQEEWVVQNMKLGYNDYVYRFSFGNIDATLSNKDTVNVIVSLTSARVNSASSVEGSSFSAIVTSSNSNNLLGVDIPGAQETLKRGGGDFDVQREAEVPDYSGGPTDCSPIAATNNIESLVSEHDTDGDFDDLPSSQEMITELKNDMKWNNGVLINNFLPGKQAFVNRHGLPIQTERIDRPSMDDLKDALESGGAVEISATLIRSASGQASTGHTMTGVAAARDGDMQAVGVHDPSTGEGTDMYEVTESGGENPFLLIDYPLWDGVTFIDTIFVQTWNASLLQASSGVSSAETAYSLTTEDILILTGCPAPFNGGYKPAYVLMINDLYYPVFQFEFDGECWYPSGVAVNIAGDGFIPLGTAQCDALEYDAFVDEGEATSFFQEFYNLNS